MGPHQVIKKPRSEKRRTTRVLTNIRCYPEEKAAIENKAKKKGMSVGGYLRECALNRLITPRGDSESIDKLIELGARQKAIYDVIKREGMTPELSKQFTETLVAMKMTLQNFNIR